MEVILHGVRGSIASPSPGNAFYGGNTLCVEVRAGGAPVFFDAGTRLREAGAAMPEAGECHIFLSHGHTDHILGLWFFKPLHSPLWTTHLYMPHWLRHIPDYFYQGGLFPVPFSALKGKVQLHALNPGEPVILAWGKEEILPFAVRHPGRGLGYRMRADGSVFVYSGDHEIPPTPEGRAEAAEFLRGADIAVVDATYGRNDYQPGWGHSAWEDWVEAAGKSQVGNLVLCHHDPSRSDQELDALDQTLQNLEEAAAVKIYVAKEGMRFMPSGPIPFIRQGSDWLFNFLDELSIYREESAILDLILTKAREITHADAGTIFLREGRELVFSYTHNDSLFSADNAYRYAYASVRLPVSVNSIAGYVASTGQTLKLDDVHNLPADAPYSFNQSFDLNTGYRTCSMLVLPFIGERGQVSGVLQLINSLNPGSGRPGPFTPDMMRNTRLLAREASGILARSAQERRHVYSLLRMAEVHDPAETGPHAERVGSIAAELYQRWAERRGISPDTLRYEKSRIRLAAMLHDIGKVGISDLILKKPGKLSDEEFALMRGHSRIGASILGEDSGDIAAFAHDIVLHHHQKWNGSGYPQVKGGYPAGEDIPLAARITAIADVFDALVSPRCYKKPWTFAQALDLLRKEAGGHFDPFMVTCMEEIEDLILPIYGRFPDNLDPQGGWER
ncbi:MAG: HD domain-containing protein [Desulfarculales bacterium]|jgi:HD-GYP domain-containing protein (c-di-GMP phosphodiesterase class II)/phosphoribosyl 1,2-cyclic phosphodiesterase|nr:HD domain-containing protein [Desulfarculales bacterium]